MTKCSRAWRDLYAWAWWARGYGVSDSSYSGPSIRECERLEELRDAPASELIRWLFDNVPLYYELGTDRERWNMLREVAWINHASRAREYGWIQPGAAEILRAEFQEFNMVRAEGK